MASHTKSFVHYLKEHMKPPGDGVVANYSSIFRENYLTKDNEPIPLHKACARGDLEQVTLICDISNIESDDKYNYRPIHVACIFGHLTVVKYLHQHGCDIEAPGDFGNRPLHLASAHGWPDVVKYLCGHQCELDAPNDTSQRPIHFACIFGHTEIVRHLCVHGCDKEILTNRGERALHLACIYGHLEIVKFLCEQNCKIEIDKSVLDLAIQKGRHDIHKFLFNKSLKRQLVEKISNMKVECDEPCDHSSCYQSIYSRRSLIGRGGFGAVFKVNYPKPNCILCVKSIFLDPGARNQKTKHIEFNIKEYLHILHHERIVQYYGVINMAEEMLIFMEYVEGVSLDKNINKKPLPHNKVIQYSKEILEGLKFLHENKIIHRDIKPQNIMLDAEEHVKLCDFGLSCYLENIGQRSQIYTGDSSSKMTQCGTPNYMAPECVTGQKYSYPVDIWSLGASVVEMLTGVPPFFGMGYCAIIFHIGTIQKIEFIPAEPMSESMKSFVGQMLCPCPSTRATAEKLLEFIDEELEID